jgi:DNA-binding MarR family transcriptional regulator
MQNRKGKGMNYRALAEFRYQIRRFLNFSEHAARRRGLEPQQHQALLALKGLPQSLKATVGVLAERLHIQHHSAVELADRLEAHGLVSRTRNRTDRREVLLRLRTRGEKLLQQLSRPHHRELRQAGPALVRTLIAAIGSAHSERRTVKPRLAKSAALVPSKSKTRVARPERQSVRLKLKTNLE